MKPWTEKHRREALRRTYELAARLAEKGLGAGAAFLAETPHHFTGSEAMWRARLSRSFRDAARIDREVRRLRGLAEGRLVRETVWYATRRSGARLAFYLDLVEAREAISAWRRSDPGSRLVRVSRIRRAS